MLCPECQSDLEPQAGRCPLCNYKFHNVVEEDLQPTEAAVVKHLHQQTSQSAEEIAALAHMPNY